jgi:hypothetical protein
MGFRDFFFFMDLNLYILFNFIMFTVYRNLSGIDYIYKKKKKMKKIECISFMLKKMLLYVICACDEISYHSQFPNNALSKFSSMLFIS